jgi:hypothetical protein
MDIHPSLYKQKQKQCLAFTKEHRRCRLEQLNGEKTCSIHRNYYTDWFEKHAYILKYIPWEKMTPRIRKELEFQLKFHHVTITEHDIIREFWNLIITDNYEKLILYQCINPIWCPHLFDALLDKYIHKFIYTDGFMFHTVREYNKLLESFISIDRLNYVFSYIHYRCIWLISDRHNHIIPNLHEIIYSIWNVTLSSPAWRPFLYFPFEMNEYFMKIKDFLVSINVGHNAMTDINFNQSFDEYFVIMKPFLQDRIDIEKKIQIRKVLFHDELVFTTSQKNWRLISTT